MVKRIGVLSALLALGLVGCASSGKDVSNAVDSGEQSAGVEVGNQVQTDVAAQGGESSSGGSAAVVQKNEGPEIDAKCRHAVVSFIRKKNGDLQVLTVDGTLHNVKSNGDVAIESHLPDGVDNYVLLPAEGVVVHFINGQSVMVESSDKGEGLFRLTGNPKKKRIYFNTNMTELALEAVNGSFSVWDMKKGIEGASENERFQDYVNRQSPDHQIGFPGDVTSLAISSNNHIFVALNEVDSGVMGRLYHFDPDAADPDAPPPPPEPVPEPAKDKKGKKAKKGKVTKTGNENRSMSTFRRQGVLMNMVRANSPIVDISVSANMKYVAAVDEKGEVFFTGVENPSFIKFGEKFTDVRKALFNGDNPIIVRRSGVVSIDSQNKSVIYEIEDSYDTCAVSAGDLYCSKGGYFDIRSASNGKLKARYVFQGDKYGVIKDGKLSGTLEDACIVGK